MEKDKRGQWFFGKKGKDHPAYKNGEGKGYDYRNRVAALALLGNVCQVCGSKEHLNLHHIDKNPLNNHPSNWKILCASCHRTVHSKWYGFTEEQKRELLKIQRRKYYKTIKRDYRPRGFLTSKEVCIFLKISRERLRQKRDRGDFKFVTVGKRTYFYDGKSIPLQKSQVLERFFPVGS